jgi:hypothetical protein
MVDEVDVFLLLFRAVRTILTRFHISIQVFKVPLWTFRDLVQFTPCLPIHGGIVSIIPRIRPLKVRIAICTLWRPIVDQDIIIQHEGKVVDLDVGMIIIIFLVLLIHSQPYIFNKL